MEDSVFMPDKCINCEGENTTDGDFCGVDCWWLYSQFHGQQSNDEIYVKEFKSRLVKG